MVLRLLTRPQWQELFLQAPHINVERVDPRWRARNRAFMHQEETTGKVSRVAVQLKFKFKRSEMTRSSRRVLPP